jgi:hypothetical protein
MSTKLEINSKDQEKKQTVYIDISENDGQFRAMIKEVLDGVAQPVRMGYLDFIGSGDNQFMTIRAPLRKKNDDGSFETRPRQKDGKFLDAKGKPVETEAEAGREYVYLTQSNDQTKLVYGQVATLNVKNAKGDGTPTAMTLISAKVFSDDEALSAERLAYKMAKLDKTSPDYTTVSAELKELRRNTGTWHNFFINAGAEVLRDKGFEVRVKERDTAPANA